MTMKGAVGKRKYDHEKICSMYEDGYSIPQICNAIGCTSGCVIPALRKAGVTIRSISDAVHIAKTGKTHKLTGGYIGICQEKNMRMPYHRYLMEQYLCRKLTSDEVVHHIDENKKNNTISNLVVMSRSEHVRLHKSKGGIRHDSNNIK